jgi:uncharacterized protein YkvS
MIEREDFDVITNSGSASVRCILTGAKVGDIWREVNDGLTNGVINDTNDSGVQVETQVKVETPDPEKNLEEGKCFENM